MSEKFKAGEYKQCYEYKSFIPSLINKELEWHTPQISILLEEANKLIGELNAYSHLVPDIDFFIHMHVAKEATTSSRIEGTRTTIDEALASVENIAPEKRDDWEEVKNYTKALNFAIEELKELPLSMRLLKEVHKVLLAGVRGKNKCPGEVRKTQNWIGGATLQSAFFIPPEPNELSGLLTDLENFLYNETLEIPHLIKAATAHYQFETIHPFLDGNGRVGRLLIIIYFIEKGLLDKPVLYLSDFFDKNRESYYESLSMVRALNSLDQWIRFFLTGIIETSKSSIETFNKIKELRAVCEEKVKSLGKKSKTRLELLDYLYSNPNITVKTVEENFSLSTPASNKLISEFIELGVLQEKTGFKRNRYFVFEDYLNIFR